MISKEGERLNASVMHYASLPACERKYTIWFTFIDFCSPVFMSLYFLFSFELLTLNPREVFFPAFYPPSVWISHPNQTCKKCTTKHQNSLKNFRLSLWHRFFIRTNGRWERNELLSKTPPLFVVSLTTKLWGKNKPLPLYHILGNKTSSVTSYLIYFMICWQLYPSGAGSVHAFLSGWCMED